jgi:DNA-3-methyladenine glycosylase I
MSIDCKDQRATNPVAKRTRCPWPGKDPLYIQYHDREWGVPRHDDRKLFEFLLLEGFQAGLSWLTVLRKRTAFHAAMDGFDPHKIARYDERKILSLMKNPDLIRNRRKMDAAVRNARAFLAVCTTFGSFDAYIWRFVNGRAVTNTWRRMDQVPSQTETSRIMSRDLKAYGFTFVGPTICYAYMQAVGMVNDHLVDCFRHKEIQS